MKTLSEIKKTAGVIVLDEGTNEICGWLYSRNRKRMFFVAAWNKDWEKVSLSMSGKYPQWNEMCEAKETFWKNEECVVQYMPSESICIKNFKHCIHLWRPVGMEIPVPPKILI